jgi:hypothetical protein
MTYLTNVSQVEASASGKEKKRKAVDPDELIRRGGIPGTEPVVVRRGRVVPKREPKSLGSVNGIEI